MKKSALIINKVQYDFIDVPWSQFHGVHICGTENSLFFIKKFYGLIKQ